MAKAEPEKAPGADDPLSICERPMDPGQLDLSAWLPPPAAAPAAGVGAAPAAGTTEALCALSVEVWRLKGRLARLTEVLPAKELRPLQSSLVWSWLQNAGDARSNSPFTVRSSRLTQ